MSRQLATKLRYLRSSTVKAVRRVGFACPSCGGHGSKPVDTKWLVTALRRCEQCRLLFRTPTTSPEENAAFYQSAYRQGVTTQLPTDAELSVLLAEQFRGHEKNYDTYLDVLRALGVPPGASIFDFGCSWGYGSWQLRRGGFVVDAYDISAPRAAYAAQKLGVSIRRLDEVDPGTYDVFFSAHVIEHVPSVADLIDAGMRCLRPGGLFVAFTPNGSSERRLADPESWHRHWGLVHPQLIDDMFLHHRFSGRSVVIASSPYPEPAIRRWRDSAQSLTGDLTGIEMLFVVRR